MELQGLTNPATQAVLQSNLTAGSNASLATACCNGGVCTCSPGSALSAGAPVASSSSQVSLSAQAVQLAKAENSTRIESGAGVGLARLLTQAEPQSKTGQTAATPDPAPVLGRQAERALQAYRQQALALN